MILSPSQISSFTIDKGRYAFKFVHNKKTLFSTCYTENKPTMGHLFCIDSCIYKVVSIPCDSKVIVKEF